jgi:hypothetical protein
MNYTQFEFAFWHPFGPHGVEDREQILERKRMEIERNEWTLWSFQRRRQRTLDAWGEILMKADAAYAFCSEGNGAKTPPGAPLYCTSYRRVGEGEEWTPIPATISVPHPFRRQQREATAFIVQEIICPVPDRVQRNIRWLSLGPSGEEEWRADRVPTRGEYLIKPCDGETMRRYCAVLVLKKPYFALVRAEN